MNPDGLDEPGDLEFDDPAMAEALDWFVRRRDGAPDFVQEKLFLNWANADPVHAEAYAEVVELWGDLDEVPATEPLFEVWPESVAPRPRRWRWAGGAIAASLMLVLSVEAPSLWIAAVADESTGTGEVRDLTLADGTRVALGADSAIDVSIDAGSRKIRLLKGRAWFDVVHEARPFTVAFGDAQVRDIGTAFEVTERVDGGEVSVTEGVVELTTSGGKALQLTEGEAARFDAAGRSRPIEAAPGVAPWREHRLQFVDQKVEDILDDLGRYGAGRSVVLDRDLARRRITGVVDLTDPAAARDVVLARVEAEGRRVGPWLFVSRR